MQSTGYILHVLICLGFICLNLTPVHAEETVRVGVFDNKPIVFRTESGKMDGIAIDILEDIARQNDWKLDYHYAPWGDLLTELDNEQIDILVGIAYTTERAKHYSYTRQTLVNNWAVVYQSNNLDLSSISELDGQRVALMKQSVHSRRFDELMKGFGFNYIPYLVPHYSDVLAAVEENRADAGVVNRIFSLANEGKYQVKPTSILFNPVQVRIAAPGHIQSPYLPVIDAYLEQAKQNPDSLYYETLKKWLEQSRQDLEIPIWLWPLVGMIASILLLSWLYAYLVRTQVQARSRELAEAESRFSQLADAVDAVFWISSPDWRAFFYVSPAYQRIWGDKPENLYKNPDTWLEHVHSNDRARIAHIIQEKSIRVTSGYSLPEYRVINTQGVERWVSARLYPIHDFEGNIVRLAGIAQDVTEIKQAEQALRKSEKRYRTLIEHAPEAITVMNVDNGKFVDVNPVGEKLFKMDRERLLTMGPAELSPEMQPNGERSEKLAMEYITRALNGETPVFEWVHQDAEGKPVYCEIRLVSLPFEDGHIVRGSITDITERKRIQAALEESEERLELAINGSNDGIWDWKDISSETLWWSSRLYEIFGYKNQEFEPTFKHFTEMLHPDDRDWVSAAIQAHLYNKAPYDVEFRCLTKQGLYHWYRARGQAIWDERGNPLRMSGSVQDITAEKLAKDNLQLREAQLEEAQRIAHLGSWDLDLENGRAVWSDEEFRLLGYEIDGVEACVDNFMAAIHPEDKEIVNQAMQQALKSASGEYDVEHRVQHADGTIRYVLEQGQVNYDEQGQPVSMIGTTLDVTEQVRAQQELLRHKYHLEELVEERTAELQRINKELESFSYSVSHDLRAPLRAIDGFSQALLEDYQASLDKTGQDYLQRIRKAAGNMSSIIDSLLKLSRVTRSKFKREKVNLSELAKEIAEEQKQVQTQFDLQFIIEPDMTVYGDRSMLEVMLTNLLNNAVKYSCNEPEPRIELGTRSDDSGKTVFFVSDNGVGFDMRFADKLFGAFQRLHAGDEFEGIGIGLATVQRIIHRHGGRIWAESNPGKGAVFYFVL
ncbi:MAG: PAS domain-containing protein [Thiohalophilus sp.]|jgi:PAS domain S-box-containing protein